MKALKIVALVSVIALFYIACGGNETSNGNANRSGAAANANKTGEATNTNKPSGTVVVDNVNTPANANQSATVPASASNVDAVALYKEQKCINCHGEDGKGKAKGSPDFTSAEWQSKKTDEELANGIKKGDPPKMPPFAAKLSEDQIKAMVAYVRSLKK